MKLECDEVPDSLKVFKEECLYCFLTADSSDGLFIPLKAGVAPSTDVYDALCRAHLDGHMERRFGDKAAGVALARLQTRKTRIVDDATKVKEPLPKRLAIGLPGGVQLEGESFTSEESWAVASFPSVEEAVAYDSTDVPVDVRRFVALLRDTDGAQKLATAAVTGGAWDGGERKTTRELTIPQISEPAPVPSSGWRCQSPGCPKTENLWLNLSDGSILCGRRFFDGSGGNNHAVDHYHNSGRKYPLAVNLGTINPEGADVFSYSENDEVVDPFLDVHLAHFGIDKKNMSRTEQTIEERELEKSLQMLDKEVLEEGAELSRGFGPGLTGMHNLGNSCYINSVLQVLALTPAVQRRYVAEAEAIFARPRNTHASDDVQFQSAKVFAALASGLFSPEPTPDGATEAEKLETAARTGIRPNLFRSLIGRGHAEFSTRQQQDAEEFLRFFLEKLGGGPGSPSADFVFRTEERFEDLASSRCRYTNKEEIILTVPLPLDLVENKEQVAEYKKKLEEAKASGKPLPDAEVVRPRVSLSRSLERLGSRAHIEGYKSPVTGEVGGATRQMSLLTFPDFLLVHLGRFVQGDDGSAQKLQASVEVRDVMDLDFLRSKGGQQPGEALLDAEPEPQAAEMDSDSLAMLIGFGFSKYQVCVAFRRLQPAAGAPAPDANAVAEWLFSNAADIPPEPMETAPKETPAPPATTDGPARYALAGFISHTGASVQTGHYIAHVKRDGRWFLLNDEKVLESKKVPQDLAYVYLFQRLPK